MNELRRRLTWLQSLPPDPRLVVGWAVAAALIGTVLHLDGGWVAFVAILPAALIGLQTAFRGQAAVSTLPTTLPAPATADAHLENRLARVQGVVHDLEHAATTLLTLGSQQGGVGEQAAVITRATRTLNDFNEMADRARREAVYLSVVSRQTASVARSGQDALAQTSEGINTMQARVNDVVALLGALARHLRSISQINAAVSEIATQSNFLALNAAIEAARAGAQGRSFATVADEVRALSEQARAAVAQIRDLLTQVHRAMEQVVGATEQQAQSVEAGAAVTYQAREAINKLTQSLSESMGTVQKIIAAIDHQSESIEGLVTSVNTVGQATLQSQAELRLTQNIARDLRNLASELSEISGGRAIATPGAEPNAT
jgi:methyl-accepting chemotaxis protein